jgi:hypothetical protein
MDRPAHEVIHEAKLKFIASQPHPDDVETTENTYVINGSVFTRVSRVIDRICGAFTGTPRTPAMAARWEAARQDGVDMHSDIDRWLSLVVAGSIPLDEHVSFESVAAEQVHRWIIQSGMIPVASELLVVSREHKYAGRVDCVMYDPAVRLFCVVDWKRIAQLRQHHLARYTRQLRLYRFALEEMFPDVAFSPRSMIVHAHDDMMASRSEIPLDDDDDDSDDDAPYVATVARATTGLSISDETMRWELQGVMAGV